METYIVSSLDTRRAKKDGTYPIVLRLTHKKNSTTIPTGYSVEKKDWNEGKRVIRKTCQKYASAVRTNNIIQQRKAEYIEKLGKLHDRGELHIMSLAQVKAKLVKKSTESKSVFQFMQQLIEDMKVNKQFGTARSTKDALRAVKKFQGGKDFTFYDLNLSWLMRFENDYLSRGLSVNGLSVYMRALRAMYNKAVKAELVEKEAYPFDKYTIKSKPTVKRAISPESIEKIIALEIPEEEILFRTRNIFLMSFYMMGASFVDLVFLKVENIVDGRIRYQRRKTSRIYDIGITPQLQEILDHYTKGKTKDDFILPLIKRESDLDQFKDFESVQNRYNKHLKKLGELAGIGEKLTGYVSRHSFATMANEMEIPITAISQMLGHKRISTTQVYLAGLKKNVIDSYNDQILGSVKAS